MRGCCLPGSRRAQSGGSLRWVFCFRAAMMQEAKFDFQEAALGGERGKWCSLQPRRKSRTCCPRGPSLSLESKGQSEGGQSLFAAGGNSGTCLSCNSPASEAFSAKCCPKMDMTGHKKLPRGPITDCWLQARSLSYKEAQALAHGSASQIAEHFGEPGQQTKLRGYQTPWCV